MPTRWCGHPFDCFAKTAVIPPVGMIPTGLGTIVVIDDDQVYLHYLATLLTCAGYRGIRSRTRPRRSHTATASRTDLVITDLFMPVLRHIKRDTPSLRW
jgi:PleD family two-component response regulator